MKKIISKSKLCKVIRENINTSLRNSRLHGLIDQIDWYSWVSQEHNLSQEQIEQLKELRDAVVCFGEIGVQWAHTADEILRENGFSDDTMSYYTNDIHESKENKHSLFESADGTRATNRIITKLYKVVNMFNQIYRDDAWQNVMRVKEALSKVEGVKDVSFWAGQYHNYIMKQKPNDPAYRTYRIQITTIFDTIIDGELTCHAAGTVDDEFSAYDLTCSFWRGE